MQLLMKVSRRAACSFRASAVALQPRMRCCTFFDTGVAGTACSGGVAVTGLGQRAAAWAMRLGAEQREAGHGQRETSRRGSHGRTIANLTMRAPCRRIKNC